MMARNLIAHARGYTDTQDPRPQRVAPTAVGVAKDRINVDHW